MGGRARARVVHAGCSTVIRSRFGTPRRSLVATGGRRPGRSRAVCPRGHDRTNPANIRISADGRRCCLRCIRIRADAYRERACTIATTPEGVGQHSTSENQKLVEPMRAFGGPFVRITPPNGDMDTWPSPLQERAAGAECRHSRDLGRARNSQHWDGRPARLRRAERLLAAVDGAGAGVAS